MEDNSCQCDECIKCCKYKPGWFLPGEVEVVATFLKISMEELFETKLSVDWWEGDLDDDIFVLSPAVVDGNPGSEFSADPHGTCVFLDDNNMCQIHLVKPFECYEAIHTDNHEITGDRHEQIAILWQSHKEQIIELLGREPRSSEYNNSTDIFKQWLTM